MDENETEKRTTGRRNYLSSFGIGLGALTFGRASNRFDFNHSSSSSEKSSHQNENSHHQTNSLVDQFTELTRETKWNKVQQRLVNFDAYHTQGMCKIGDTFFVSAVEIQKLPGRYTKNPNDDGSLGKGIGHLFKFTADGKLIGQLKLQRGPIYHPGGIGYDGEHIWMPLAEYKPDSHAIIYRVDPQTMNATPMFRVDDHIGGLVRDTATGMLYGVNWGSRKFYEWRLPESSRELETNGPQHERVTTNDEYYIDYQDLQYVGDNLALCSGITVYQQGNSEFQLGGIDLVDLRTLKPIYQVPVPVWTDSGMVMTRNPFSVEKHSDGLRFFFMPEDDQSHLYTFDAHQKDQTN